MGSDGCGCSGHSNGLGALHPGLETGCGCSDCGESTASPRQAPRSRSRFLDPGRAAPAPSDSSYLLGHDGCGCGGSAAGGSRRMMRAGGAPCTGYPDLAPYRAHQRSTYGLVMAAYQETITRAQMRTLQGFSAQLATRHPCPIAGVRRGRTAYLQGRRTTPGTTRLERFWSELVWACTTTRRSSSGTWTQSAAGTTLASATQSYVASIRQPRSTVETTCVGSLMSATLPVCSVPGVASHRRWTTRHRDERTTDGG